MQAAKQRCRNCLATTLATLCVGAIGACHDEAPTNASDASSRSKAERAARTPDSPQPPNLVLITLDTTRADALGPYGQLLSTSPVLDRLAEQGVVFEHVTTSNPETLPAHATIFTGLWPFAHGVRANAGFVLSDRHTTLAEHLRDHGYATGAEVSALVLREDTQVTQGFDAYHDPATPGVTLKEIAYTSGSERSATLDIRVGSDVTARGVAFIRKHRKEPFFLWLHYFDAHHPYSPPPLYQRRIPESPYHAEVAYADAQIGAIVDELARLGLSENSVVVVTADHGEGLEDHGEPSHSYYVYDTVMRVPLVFWGHRDLPRGQRVASLVRTVDIAPTVLDVMGLPALDGMQGVTLKPLLRGTRPDLGLTGYGEATRFRAAFGLPTLRFVREGRWKYIHKVGPELYDVVADPLERLNRVDDEPEVAARLRARLGAMLEAAPRSPDDAQANVDAATARQLMALGYVSRAPTLELANGKESLVLGGDDPALLAPTVRAMSRARSLVDREKYAIALDELSPVAARYPDSTIVLRVLARAYDGLDRRDDTIATLRRLVALDPADKVARHELAISLWRAGHADEATQRLAELLAETPCNESMRVDHARILQEQHHYDGMLASLAESTRLCPQHLGLANNHAWALATLPDPSLRDGDRAVAVIRAVIEASGTRDPAHLDTLAAALAETGDFDGARRTVQIAIETLRRAGAPPALVQELAARRDGYAARRPARDPASG